MCGNNGCFGGGNLGWIISLIRLFCNCGWGGNWGGCGCCNNFDNNNCGCGCGCN